MQHYGKIKDIKSTLLLIIILGLLVSCDCIHRIQGYAIDAQTGKPLSEVFYSRDSLLRTEEKQVERTDTFQRYHPSTDSTGWFMGWRIVNGFTCRPHLVLWLDKEGYEPVRLKSSRNKGLDTLVVKMHKKNSR